MGRHYARTGITRQADAGNMAFCNVVARLLALTQTAEIRHERSIVSTP
jgi:hypothetical protein